jgi:enoyl-CoA hydratase/carnithine racemase
MQTLRDNYFNAYRSLRLTRDAGRPASYRRRAIHLYGAGSHRVRRCFLPHRAGAGRAEAFLLNPQPITAADAHQWGVVAEVVPNGKALSQAHELARQYLKVPEVTRRNTRVHFIQPLKERIVREVGYGLSLEGASAAALVKSMQAKS